MAEYFDAEHRRDVKALLSGFTARTEWPTWLLIIVVYGSWILPLIALHRGLITLAFATPFLILSSAWYMSLQHELLHGHPTRFAWINALFGYAPIAVWYPYALYRDSHLTHHRDEDLTMPGVDPESNYVHPENWRTMSFVMRALWQVRKTFVGRFVVGPPMAVATMLAHAMRQFRRGHWRELPMWCVHGALLVVMLTALSRYAHISGAYYVFVIAWPALSIAMIRSFYEHRSAPHSKARITINEAGALMRVLFLNNNYHLVHHDIPHLPWYLLPVVYQMRKPAYIEKCGGFRIRGGYGELLRRYAFRWTDAPVHPSAE